MQKSCTPSFPRGRAGALCLLAGAIFGAVAAPGRGWAGPNGEGSLIIHANPSLNYTIDQAWCGRADISRAERAIVDVDPSDSDHTRKYIWFVLAVFPTYASPKVAGLTFGVDYDSQVTIEAVGICGASFELASSNPKWPESGSGTALQWNEVQRDRVFEVYWFAGYGYTESTFRVTEHPFSTTGFADDSIPAEIDPIEGYGTLGFGIAGHNPYLAFLPTGACCNTTGVCTTTIRDLCEDAGKTYFGDYTDCPVNSSEQCRGPCCIDGQCNPGYTPRECDRAGGEWKDFYRDCGRTACIPTRTSFGTLKSIYRN